MRPASNVNHLICAQTSRCEPVEMEERPGGSRSNVGSVTDPVWITSTAASLAHLDRLYECRSSLWGVVRSGRNRRAVVAVIESLLLLGMNGFLTGEWGEARECAEEGVRLARSEGYSLMAYSGLRWAGC